MDSLFVGRPWRVTSPQGPFTAGAARLTGRAPQRAEAWGKHLFIHVGADIWQVHLGLYGAFSFQGDEQFAGAASLGAPRTATEQLTPHYDDDGWIIPTPPTGAVRARVHTRHGWADLRGPATCRVLNPMRYEQIIGRLGPDPLRQADGPLDEQMLQSFAQNLSRRRISIAAALMDQAVIAGVGNIYRAESLFVEGIDPDTPAARLTEEQVRSLWQTLTRQLRHGFTEGVIRTLREPETPRESETRREPGTARGFGTLSDPQTPGRNPRRRHWVYKHQGTRCLRCGETIRSRELAGRRLYWCPGCQTA